MDAEACTGMREKGGVRSKDNDIFGAYDRDTLSDNRELLLFFANNHDLAIVNTFFSAPKGGCHTLSTCEAKRIDYILLRQRDRKIVRNVTVHPQPSLFLISDFFFFFFFHLTYNRWTSSLPSCLWSQRIFPSLPGSRLTIFFIAMQVQHSYKSSTNG